MLPTTSVQVLDTKFGPFATSVITIPVPWLAVSRDRWYHDLYPGRSFGTSERYGTAGRCNPGTVGGRRVPDNIDILSFAKESGPLYVQKAKYGKRTRICMPDAEGTLDGCFRICQLHPWFAWCECR
jgi:hypothetical protein